MITYLLLNDIKMLMNYGYDSVNYFTLILCGESHLNDTLRKPVHEALRQRITVHYNYTGLSDDEVSKYILHKLQLAGASTNIISPAALAAAHSYTQGNPRLIICSMWIAKIINVIPHWIIKNSPYHFQILYL